LANTINFKSPTFFKKNNKEYPWPDAYLIFRNVLRKWMYFAPENINFSDLILSDLDFDIVNASGQVVQLKIGAYRHIGYMGTLRLKSNPKVSDEKLAMYNALIRFATYAGVGNKTSMGCGAIRIS
jgi:CRISPR-associated endoribonuclease Cas6